MGESRSYWKKTKLQFVRKIRKVEGLGLFLFPMETGLKASTSFWVLVELEVMELESNVWVQAVLQEILETFRLERPKLRVLGAWLQIHKGLELVFHHYFVISQVGEGP